MPIIVTTGYTPGSTSSGTNYTLNRNQIITMALRKLRVVDPNDTANTNDITTGSEALNIMIKAWQMENVMMWTNQEVVLLLQKDAQTYDIGPSGDNCCLKSEAGKTTLTAASAASDTTLTVDSITGIADADIIAIELDSGAMHFDTVNGSPSGSTVTITTGVVTSAASGNYVFHYTNKISRPVEILEARIRDTDDNDSSIRIVESINEFMGISDKTSSGDCLEAHLIPTITDSKLYTWPVPDDVTKRIFMTVKRVIEDFDASTDNADAPVECLDAIIWNLALWLAPEYTKVTPSDVQIHAVRSFAILKRFYGNKRTVQLSP